VLPGDCDITFRPPWVFAVQRVGKLIPAAASVDFKFDGEPRAIRAGAKDLEPLPRYQRDRSAAD